MLIEVKTATENCAERCKFFRVDTTDLYANDEVYHRVHTCKFYDICSKLYDDIRRENERNE